MRNYRVCSMGQMHSVYYRDLDKNKIDTFVTELEVDEKAVSDVLDLVAIMICMVISGDIPIIDLGRLYMIEAASGRAVKMTVSGVPEDVVEAENDGYKNFVIDKTMLLLTLTRSLEERETRLGLPTSFKLTKLDITTEEMFHNCHTNNIPDKSMVKDLFQDLMSLVYLFPLSGRSLVSLTDLRLGNCLTNMVPIKGNADVMSQKVMAGVGQCCPSLKVLDLRGSELDPAIAIWLLLKDPFMALHKYCYTVYKGDQGETEIREHREDCMYCKDQDGEEAREVKKVTMEDRRFHWSPLADDVWEILEKNDWHFVIPGGFKNYFDKKKMLGKSLANTYKECSDSDSSGSDSDWETVDEVTASECSEDDDCIENDIAMKKMCVDDTNKTDDVNEDTKRDLYDSMEDEEVCGKLLTDWKIDTSPANPLFPKLHVISASALINCLNEVNSSPCNPLTTTLEVLYISGHTLENFLSEAIFPFLFRACPNLKIIGDSFAGLKGLRLFSSMEATKNCVTDLREVDMVYPSTYDGSGTDPSVAAYMVLGTHNTVTFPTSDSLSALLPYVPMTMLSSENMKGFPAGVGWLSAENLSLIDLYLEENPLKDITNPFVMGGMVKEDCQMLAKLCPNLAALKISLDHPWGVTDQAYFWSGLSPLSLSSLQVLNGRWENVSPLLEVVGRTLTDIHIILPKRNNALQGEIDCLSKNCPILESLYLGVGTSPLEVRDLDMFKGFKHLKTVYIGEAFTWESFQALLCHSPKLEKVQVDKINEHLVGKPPNVVITDLMVKELGSLMVQNGAGTKVEVLSFSWLDLDKKKLVETVQALMSVFPSLKWLGTLALNKRDLVKMKDVVSMAKEEGIVIDTLDTEEESQPGAEFEGLPIGEGCCIN